MSTSSNGSANGDATSAQPTGMASLSLLERVERLEAEQKRFMDALKFAGEALFKGSASKMILMALPKDLQEKLKEHFGHASS